MIDWLSWVAMVCTLISMYLAAKKRISTWLWGGASTTMWTVYAVLTHQSALTATDIAILMFNIYGYIQWSKNKN